jgi:hypothetical protein
MLSSSHPQHARVKASSDNMGQIKSKQRVADHGEVFTPPELVEAMLDLVKDETERIDSRFLEPACGSGNFLVRILQRKLDVVVEKYGKSDFENRQYSLLAVMSIYGIELLSDNIVECRQNVLEILTAHLKLDDEDTLLNAASYVLSQNLVHGDAMTMLTNDGEAITFAEWGYLGKGKYQRRDFRYDVMTRNAAVKSKNSLFAYSPDLEVYAPDKVYPQMTMSELAEMNTNGGE